MAEIGAREGIAFADKTGIDPSVLAMIYEKASHERTETTDTAALNALRNYWRCALLGNMCWQLAHTHKAQPVVVENAPAPDKNDKPDKKADKPATAQAQNDATAPKAPKETDHTVVKVTPDGATTTNVVAQPAEPKPATNADENVNPPVAPIATNEMANTEPPPPATKADSPPVAPVATPENPPIAPIATPDYSAVVVPPGEVHAAMHPTATNTEAVVAPPVIPVAPIASETTNPPVPPPAPPVANTPVTNAAPAPPAPSTPAPTVTAANSTDDPNIPVAPIAKATDYSSGDTPPPTTNAAPVIGPIPPSKPIKSNADGGAGAFP
jgi:hypothetical protein